MILNSEQLPQANRSFGGPNSSSSWMEFQDHSSSPSPSAATATSTRSASRRSRSSNASQSQAQPPQPPQVQAHPDHQQPQHVLQHQHHQQPLTPQHHYSPEPILYDDRAPLQPVLGHFEYQADFSGQLTDLTGPPPPSWYQPARAGHDFGTNSPIQWHANPMYSGIEDGPPDLAYGMTSMHWKEHPATASAASNLRSASRTSIYSTSSSDGQENNGGSQYTSLEPSSRPSHPQDHQQQSLGEIEMISGNNGNNSTPNSPSGENGAI